MVQLIPILDTLTKWTIELPFRAGGVLLSASHFIFSSFFSLSWLFYNLFRGIFQIGEEIGKRTVGRAKKSFTTNFVEPVEKANAFSHGKMYLVKLMLLCLFQVVFWLFEFMMVLLRSVIPLLFVLTLGMSFGVLLFGFLSLEGNLDVAQQIIGIIVTGTLSFLQIILLIYDGLAQILEPIVPLYDLGVSVLVRLTLLIYTVSFETLGLSTPKYGRSLLPDDKLFHSHPTYDSLTNSKFSQSFFPGDSIHGERILAQGFFSQDGEFATETFDGYYETVSAVVHVFFAVLSILFDIGLIFWELYLRFFASILQGLLSLLFPMFRSFGCCSTSFGCCVREYIGNFVSILQFIPGIAELAQAIKCQLVDFEESQCKCSIKEGGFYQNALECPAERYFCRKDESTGLYTQYKVVGNSPPENQLSSYNYEEACPQVFRNLHETSRNLATSVQYLPYKPANCSSYCYPNKRDHRNGWMVTRCLTNDHLEFEGTCSVSSRGRALDIDQSMSKITSELKTFVKQYKPSIRIKLPGEDKPFGKTYPPVYTNDNILKEEFVQYAKEREKHSTFQFPKAYDVLSGLFLPGILFDQIELVKSIAMDPPNIERLNDLIQSMVLYVEGDTVDASKKHNHRYLLSTVAIGDDMKWSQNNKHPQKIQLFFHYYDKLIANHHRYMKEVHNYDSNVGYVRNTHKAITTLYLNTTKTGRRGRTLTSLTDTQPGENLDETLGVFGYDCPYLCPDLVTCVSIKDLETCPEPASIWGYILYPFYYVSVLPRYIDMRLLIDTTFECWLEYETNPSINPLAVIPPNNNFELVWSLSKNRQLTNSEERRIKNLKWCFPLVRTIPRAPKITWSWHTFMQDTCGGESAQFCTCPMFPNANNIFNYNTKILSFFYEFQLARVQNFYAYLNLMLSSMFFNTNVNNWYKGFLDWIGLNIPEGAKPLYNLFDYEYATAGVTNSNQLAFCYAIHIPSLIYVMMFNLMPLFIFIYAGLFALLYDIAFKVVYIGFFFVLRNTLTIVDAIGVEYEGMSEQELYEYRRKILKEASNRSGLTFSGEALVDGVSTAYNKIGDAKNRVLKRVIQNLPSNTPTGTLMRYYRNYRNKRRRASVQGKTSFEIYKDQKLL